MNKRTVLKVLRQCLAELVGTLILCGFGNASIAVFIIEPSMSSSLSVHFSWGLGAAFGVYAAKSISGGHINPAITITKTVMRKLPVYKMLLYIIFQTFGAFLSSCLVYLAYIDMELNEKNAKIFATYPRDNVSIGQALGTSTIGTMLMVHSICAVNDLANKNKPMSNLEPLFLGLAVFLYGITFSLNTGYAINPARDLGPRLFIHMIGFPNAFSRGNNLFGYYWWVPLLGPVLGALLGTVSYQLLFTNLLFNQTSTEDEAARNNNLETIEEGLDNVTFHVQEEENGAEMNEIKAKTSENL